MDEEKEMEVEALMAIYMDDFRILGEEHFEIALVPNPGGDDNHVAIAMEVTFPNQYPQVVPTISLKNITGVSRQELSLLQDKVKQQAQESVGMAMIFTLASTVKEWLDEHNINAQVPDPKATAPPKPADVTEEPFQGTPVSIESFMAWKHKFDKDMAEDRIAKGIVMENERNKRLTGKQLFLMDATLILSDAGLLEEGEETAIISAEDFRKAKEANPDSPETVPSVNWALFSEDVDIDES